jgi:TRAP-type C4-dicarboxylate transport system substrate-binding protein
MNATAARLAVAAAAAALALAACTGSGTVPDKAGGEPPITLRLGSADASDNPTAPQLEYFVHQVEQLSRGRVRIDVEYRTSFDAPEPEAAVVRKVKDGRLDLG